MFPVKETLQRHWKKARKKAFRAHPAGLSTHEGILYVAEQGTNSVLAFDIATQTFLHTVIGPNNFLSTVESIELSQC